VYSERERVLREGVGRTKSVSDLVLAVWWVRQQLIVDSGGWHLSV
jgi:hypothetical protein